MSIVSKTRGYKGRGEFEARPLAGGRPFMLGNLVELSEAIATSRSGRENFQSSAGGELDVDEPVTSYTFSAVCNDISPRNIALGLLGRVDAIAQAAVASEPLDVWTGVPRSFKYLPDPSVPPTVAIAATESHQASTAYAVGAMVLEGGRGYLAVVGGTSDASAPTFPTDYSTVTDGTVTWKDVGLISLVAGTDFEAVPHGIRMLSAAEVRFHDDLPIPMTVAYTRNAQSLITALTDAGQEYELIWHGENAVDSGNPITRKYFRVKFSPTSGFGVHGGADYASLTLNGTVLADLSRTGEGESQYQETVMV